MNAEEFRAFAERPGNDGRWFELVRGEVIEIPPPGGRRFGVVCANIGYHLGAYTHATGGGVAQMAAGVILSRDPDTVRCHDVAVYANDKPFDWGDNGWNDEPPLVAVEVRAFNDVPGLIEGRVADYLEAGVPFVWVIDPDAHTATVHTPHEQPLELGTDDILEARTALPGFRLHVGDIFRLPGEGRA